MNDHKTPERFTMLRCPKIPVGEVTPDKDTIVERFTTGSISARIRVADKGPCVTDASNIHIVDPDGKIRCYYREFPVELL